MDPTLIKWLAPTIAAMFAWGIAQGLVKKYVGDVPPARFCLYYAVANFIVGVGFWALWPVVFGDELPAVLADEHRAFLYYGLAAYILDGIAWIFYYQSIVTGPISIVGTLSAAYPGLSVLIAAVFLDEQLTAAQYAGVALVLGGCLMLAWSPADPNNPGKGRQWMLFAGLALLIWGINANIVKYSYSLPGASEGNFFLFIALGGACTLGVYGFIKGRKGAANPREWKRSFAPMVVMSLGGVLAAFAYKFGPVSIVTPLTGAYPVVTLGFAWAVLKERPTKVHWVGIVACLLGMVLSTLTPEEAPAVEAAPAAVTAG